MVGASVSVDAIPIKTKRFLPRVRTFQIQPAQKCTSMMHPVSSWLSFQLHYLYCLPPARNFFSLNPESCSSSTGTSRRSPNSSQREGPNSSGRSRYFCPRHAVTLVNTTNETTPRCVFQGLVGSRRVPVILATSPRCCATISLQWDAFLRRDTFSTWKGCTTGQPRSGEMVDLQPLRQCNRLSNPRPPLNERIRTE